MSEERAPYGDEVYDRPVRDEIQAILLSGRVPTLEEVAAIQARNRRHVEKDRQLLLEFMQWLYDRNPCTVDNCSILDFRGAPNVFVDRFLEWKATNEQ